MSFDVTCVFTKKNPEFRNKLNWILKIWGGHTGKNDTLYTNIQINGPKLE